MKHMNIVVSVIIAAAVLVAAYGVGLLVRHARMDGQLTATESPGARKAGMGRHSPADSNLAAQTRQKREQMLEKVKTMSPEEKRRLMDEQVRSRFDAGGKGQSHKMSPEEREKIAEKWQSLSEQGKKGAADARIAESKPASSEQTQAPANAEGAVTPESPDPGGSEPNKAGKG